MCLDYAHLGWKEKKAEFLTKNAFIRIVISQGAFNLASPQ